MRDVISQVARRGESQTIRDLELTSSTGERTMIDVHVTPLRESGGIVTGVVAIVSIRTPAR